MAGPYDVRPYSSYNNGPAADESKGVVTHYCPECCNVCKLGDKFCSRCGCTQALDEEQRLRERVRKAARLHFD